MESTTCFHCGNECDTKTITIEDKFFCCNGCKTVYEIFSENDLTCYYDFQNNPGAIPEEIQGKYDFLDNELIVDFELYPPSQGSSFTLRNIYFDFDKSDLRNKSVDELNKLAQIMKEHPSMEIELGGHTDTRGDEAYNMWLSKSRAKVARDYLIKKGIDKSRIETKGYGETSPEVSDAEISKLKGRSAKTAAHQKNRRTVVKVIKE